MIERYEYVVDELNRTTASFAWKDILWLVMEKNGYVNTWNKLIKLPLLLPGEFISLLGRVLKVPFAFVKEIHSTRMKLKLNLQFSSHFPSRRRLIFCSAVILLCFCLCSTHVCRSCAKIVILHFSRGIDRNFLCSLLHLLLCICVWWKSIVIYYYIFSAQCRNWKL